MINDSISKNITSEYQSEAFYPSAVAIITLPVEELQSIYCDDYIFDETVHVMSASVDSLHTNCSIVEVENHWITYSLGDKNPTRVIAFFLLKCVSSTNAVLFTSARPFPAKLWINNILYSQIQRGAQMFVVHLNQGVNRIVIEWQSVSDSIDSYIRISDYNAEQKNTTQPCIFCGDMRNGEKLGFVKHSGNHLYNNQPFTFAFYPNHDVLAQNQNSKVLISDNLSGEIYLQKEFPIRKEISIDISKWNFEDYDHGHYPVITIVYQYSNGLLFSEKIPIYAKPVDRMLNRLCERAEEAIESSEYDYDKLCLQFGIEYIRKYGTQVGPILAQASLLRQNINHILNCRHIDSTIYDHGMRRVFFYNYMYNAVNYYRVYIPENYNSEYKYPLIIIFSTIEYSAWSGLFDKFRKEPVIAVDISGRGVLLGSYIGDAAIQLALSDVFRRFNIDRDRVYCTGNSNGGGAAWAYTQAYPDMFAGAVVVSGQANETLLPNLQNIRIFNISSETDEMFWSYKIIDSEMQGNKNYTGILGKGFSHDALHYVWFNKNIFENLLSSRRNKYPNRVVYKTLRNRHLKAYWLNIHSIENGTREGQIEGEVIDEKTIYITCSGISGFSLSIPPQICGDKLTLVINGNCRICAAVDDECVVHITKTSAYDYERINNPPNEIEIYKGNGLLDVYLDPLTIVVPNGVLTDEVFSTASTYSEPYCNGFIPKVLVKYPIVTYDEFTTASDKSERSYVVLDDGSDCLFLKELRASAQISLENGSWVYRGKKYTGDCMVQQIFKSPYSSCRSIHLISYHNPSLLSKNLFTRKLIIPTYANGWHKYLNNVALVYNDGQYYGIVDYSCMPQKLS